MGRGEDGRLGMTVQSIAAALARGSGELQPEVVAGMIPVYADGHLVRSSRDHVQP